MRLLLGIVILFILAGCAEQKIVRGHILRESVLEQVILGSSTESDVLRLLGTPTTVSTFDDSVWYYIGQRRTKDGFLPTEIEVVEIHVVEFSDSGVVEKMSYFDEKDLQVFAYNDARTPTRGSELTVIQQLFGNFGRFTPATTGSSKDLLGGGN